MQNPITFVADIFVIIIKNVSIIKRTFGAVLQNASYPLPPKFLSTKSVISVAKLTITTSDFSTPNFLTIYYNKAK